MQTFDMQHELAAFVLSPQRDAPFILIHQVLPVLPFFFLPPPSLPFHMPALRGRFGVSRRPYWDSLSAVSDVG